MVCNSSSDKERFDTRGNPRLIEPFAEIVVE
jgi:hypothetical protein